MAKQSTFDEAFIAAIVVPFVVIIALIVIAVAMMVVVARKKLGVEESRINISSQSGIK